MRWACGVTTVPERMHDLLPATLTSLALGGFRDLRLFIDGLRSPEEYDNRFGLEITVRYPKIRTMGNWALGLAELYLRHPDAERYAIFQDDLVTYRNLRPYLESCHYPEKGYWNLYTFPVNQTLARKTKDDKQIAGWYLSNQMGKGAVALVFNREAVRTLFSSSHFVDRPQDTFRGWRSVDGGIVTAFKKIGWKEYVHNPSLVQHTGLKSVMGNQRHPSALSFLGEDFDAMSILQMPERTY